MGWKSDWLYGLIFKEVAAVWKRSQNEDATLGPSPFALHVLECAEGDFEGPHSHDVVRRWIYDQSGLRPAELDESSERSVQGSMYDIGTVWFHVTTTRKLVCFGFCLGPLYARGHVFEVVGQGARGRLRISGKHVRWVS